MGCLQLHSSLLPLLPMHAKLKCQQRPEQTKPLWLTTSDDPTRTVSQSQHFPSPNPLRTKALPHSIFDVAVTSSAKPVDISAFLQISALLLSVYFFANFIVPGLISKDFEFDQVNEDQKVDDVEAIDDK